MFVVTSLISVGTRPQHSVAPPPKSKQTNDRRNQGPPNLRAGSGLILFPSEDGLLLYNTESVSTYGPDGDVN